MSFPAPRTRRVEDRIRDLCRRAVTASDDNLGSILHELQVAVSEYTRRVDNNLLASILEWPETLKERRKP